MFAFWNACRKRNAPIDEAARVITALIARGATVVGLCEMDQELAVHLGQELGPEMVIVPALGSTQTGRANWDLCLLYRRSEWEHAEEPVPIETLKVGDNIRVACEWVLVSNTTETKFHFFVAHWPSQLHGHGQEKRERAANRLREVLAPHLDALGRVVVMGDFNDEPFGLLERCLDAVRDLDVVRRYPRTSLFNPFWRELGHDSFETDVRGTCLSDRKVRSSWATFDQIVLSSSIVGDPATLVRAGAFRTLFGSDTLPKWCDHAPVFVELRI